MYVSLLNTYVQGVVYIALVCERMTAVNILRTKGPFHKHSLRTILP